MYVCRFAKLSCFVVCIKVLVVLVRQLSGGSLRTLGKIIFVNITDLH